MVVALDNGRTIVSYKRGIDVCSASFDPRTCIERSATWHMVIDANGVIVPPQQTAEVIDANAAHNNATRGPSSGAKFGDGFNAVIGLGNSGQNTAGGNAVVIGGGRRHQPVQVEGGIHGHRAYDNARAARIPF